MWQKPSSSSGGGSVDLSNYYTKAAVDTLVTAVDSLVTAVDGRVTTLEGSSTSLDTRVDSLEGSPLVFEYGHQHLYNGRDGLQAYRNAILTYNTNLIRITCIGDSITEGQQTSTGKAIGAYWKENGWVNLVRQALQSVYTGNTGFGFDRYWSYSAGWDQHTQIIGVQTEGEGSWGNHLMSNPGTAVDAATITFTGTIVDFLWGKSSGGGTATVQIDGVTVTTINCASPDTSVHMGQKQTFTGLSSGSHTLTVTPNGNGPVSIDGIIARTHATKGIEINNHAVGGYRAGHFDNPGTYEAWASLPSHLAIIALGPNDFNQRDYGYAQQNYDRAYTSLDEIITFWKNLGTSVLLVSWPELQNANMWTDYVRLNYELARKHDCAHLNINDAWMQSYYAGAALGLYDDAIHPSDTGYKVIASQVEGVLKPYDGSLRTTY